jgi:hypothetical protein
MLRSEMKLLWTNEENGETLIPSDLSFIDLGIEKLFSLAPKRAWDFISLSNFFGLVCS